MFSPKSTFILFTTIILYASGVEDQACNLKRYDNGNAVCVCSAEYCDTISRPEQIPAPNFIKYTSNKQGLRFHKEIGAFSADEDTNDVNAISVNSNQEYQEIYGWGGAFTDSTALNIQSLDEKTRQHLVNSYFANSGIEYSLGRVPIGGTDFSTHAYSYDDSEGVDKDLVNFKLAPEDFNLKIPLIKQALSLSGGNLQLFASVWTAPKWMKTNNAYAGFGFLLKEMYASWANYFLKFLEAYRENGIEFWGITTGNEPSLALFPFGTISSVAWLPGQLGEWIGDYLGPLVRNSSFSGVKIMTLDDQRFFLPWYLDLTFKNEKARNFIDGIAVHWYWDQFVPASLLTTTHNHFPEKFILATEACVGDKFYEKHVDLGAWDRGERYASSVIDDVGNYVTGWVDWNMALDLNGGPTYNGNFVDSPILVNATANEFYKQPMYYTLGHFAKFIPRNSKRIGVVTSDLKVSVVAFKRPDNGTVVVILNRRENVVNVTISDDLRGVTTLSLSDKSITTLLYW